MIRPLGLVLVLALTPLAAQEPAPLTPGDHPQVTETRHLTITTSTSRGADGAVRLWVDVAPKPSMHVYAPGQEGYIPISVTLASDPAVTAGEAVFPKASRVYMKALDETQLVFDRPFRIVQPVTLTSNKDRKQIGGTVRYQACDDVMCYIPATVKVSWTVE
ncbi:MAG TPA: protein-disulfide reductase DsbD domain-containing protein [Vicinamibacterales bacterium]|nr:protein-disulfide reductase DsbD domain-containing protein [Vicinamibacterales bacterium]